MPTTKHAMNDFYLYRRGDRIEITQPYLAACGWQGIRGTVAEDQHPAPISNRIIAVQCDDGKRRILFADSVTLLIELP
jgi:hypothetical protein